MDCIACKDEIEEVRDDDNLHIQDAMRAFCRECATEVLGIHQKLTPIQLQHDSGGGRRVIRSTNAF